MEALANPECGWVYARYSSAFESVPGIPIAYSMIPRDYELFGESSIGSVSAACKGLDTGNNERFLRMWFEVDIAKIFDKKKSWVFHNKGGEFRKWYGNREYVINWLNDGHDLKYRSTANIRNEDKYFSFGITWTDLSTGSFGARLSPDDATFDASGPTAFVAVENDIFAQLAYMNCSVFQRYALFLCPGLHYNNGAIAKVPYIAPKQYRKLIEPLAEENVNLCKRDWDERETSSDFARHPLI